MPRAATTRTLITVAVGAGLALNAAILAALIRAGTVLNSDFLAFWSFPRFAPVRDIYDATALTRFQQALYPDFHSFYPYLYPPTLLLVLRPLAALPYGAALGLWTLLGVAALTLAVRPLFPRTPWPVLAALLASPAALISAATGETAFFTTALLLAGLGLLEKRPVLAGLMFGLLTLKPQLGLLLPVLLLARGDWKAIATASAVALGLVALSCVAYPPVLWGAWAHTLPQYQAQYFAAAQSLNLHIIVTPAANLVVLGVPQGIAWAVQMAVLAAVAVTLAIATRRAPYRRAAALLLAGSFIAQPHAYAYDTVALTAALALWFEDGPPTPGALALAGVLFAAPLLLLSPAGAWFLYALPQMFLFAVLARHALRSAQSAP